MGENILGREFVGFRTPRLWRDVMGKVVEWCEEPQAAKLKESCWGWKAAHVIYILKGLL